MLAGKIMIEMKRRVIDAIESACLKLQNKDGSLFNCPIEEGFNYDARKLHEVCINHKLANYLEEFILPILEYKNIKYFVDIEFNREGVNKKEIKINGIEKVVRPDIIVHNRKTRDEKDNFLVAECKKSNVDKDEKGDDVKKLKAFIEDDRYKYQYGLQIIYGNDKIKATLFYCDQGEIREEEIYNG